MSSPGWYPDPAKAPGQFRYWDGTTWSAGTSGNPADPPPGAGSAPTRRRRGPWIAAAALLIVLIVVGVLVVQNIFPGSNVNTADPGASSTVTGGDDRSPTPSPTPTPTPSDTPTPSPSPTPSAQPSAQPCPVGDPRSRQPYPSDGRQHGGGLAFPTQSGWTSPPQAITWTYDLGGQQLKVEPKWFALLAVGALSTVDGFETPEQAAEMAMQCTASSGLYDGFTERKDVASEAITVDGHPGWRFRSEVYVDSDATTYPGDVVEIIVVDLGSPESLGMFLGAVPIGDTALNKQLDKVVSQLKADQ